MRPSLSMTKEHSRLLLSGIVTLLQEKGDILEKSVTGLLFISMNQNETIFINMIGPNRRLILLVFCTL
jgi:hypothetical protein